MFRKTSVFINNCSSRAQANIKKGDPGIATREGNQQHVANFVRKEGTSSNKSDTLQVVKFLEV